SGTSSTTAVPNTLGSETLVARTMTVFGAVTLASFTRYEPLELILGLLASPSLDDHVTAFFGSPITVAANWNSSSFFGSSVTTGGLTTTIGFRAGWLRICQNSSNPAISRSAARTPNHPRNVIRCGLLDNVIVAVLYSASSSVCAITTTDWPTLMCFASLG